MASVVSVNISQEKGTIKTPVEAITVTLTGIKGDAHAGPWHRQVSLLSRESIDTFTQQSDRAFASGEFAENITTVGIDLLQLKIRDRLTLGQKREDILAGLHRAIILRAMSLLARSGGIHDEFTFTGGVAKNPAAVDALTALIAENYGKRKINISPNSIYTGALGAALFARHDVDSQEEVA